MREEQVIWDALRDAAASGDKSAVYFQTFMNIRAKMEDDHVRSNLADWKLSSVRIQKAQAILKLTADLAQQAMTMSPEGEWTAFLETAKRVASTRAKMARLLVDNVITPLDEMRHRRRDDFDRASVEMLQTEAAALVYLSKSKDDLTRLKNAYKAKASSVATLKDAAPAKVLKAQKDLAAAGDKEAFYVQFANDPEDAEYRVAVCKREEERLKFEDRRTKILYFMASMEQDRLKRTGEALRCYFDLELNWAEQTANMVRDYRISVDLVDSSRAKANYLRMFEERWQPYARVLYGHHSDGDFQDLSFGVPLELTLKQSGSAVPAVLHRCIIAIEAKGLRKEGIYRLSAKISDIHELKANLEKDLAKVQLEDYDVHVICGVVKLFLREMPEPLLDIPEQFRKEFATMPPESRTTVLQNFIRPEYKPTLRLIIYHLAKVDSFSEINKMTVQNLAVVFGPPILNGNRELMNVEPSKSKPQTLFDKFQNALSSDSQRSSSSSMGSLEMQGLELIKNDMIIEELIRDRELIFGGVPPVAPKKDFPSRFESLALAPVEAPAH